MPERQPSSRSERRWWIYKATGLCEIDGPLTGNLTVEVAPVDDAAIERGARAIAAAHRKDGAPGFDDATDAERSRWLGFSRKMAEAFAGVSDV